jgi:hypothetical protein
MDTSGRKFPLPYQRFEQSEAIELLDRFERLFLKAEKALPARVRKSREEKQKRPGVRRNIKSKRVLKNSGFRRFKKVLDARRTRNR